MAGSRREPDGVAVVGCGDPALLAGMRVVEGKTVGEWDKSTYFEGPGKLQVFNGTDLPAPDGSVGQAGGKLLAEYDLPACPVFDGMSAADGKLVIPLVNGEIVSFQTK